MNLMGPVYDWVEGAFSSDRTLGISLFLGKKYFFLQRSGFTPSQVSLLSFYVAAAITCVFSLGCGLILGFLDKRAERILERDKKKSDEVVKFTDVKDFSFQLWMIFFVCVFYYVAVFPFIGLGKLVDY